MATKDAVILGTDYAWVLIYDAAARGDFTGSAQKIGGGPARLRIADDVPLDDDRGFVATEYPSPFTINGLDKLYGRSNGNAVIILS